MYAQLATYHYAMCCYDKAFQFTVLAIEQIRACRNDLSGLSGYVIVEVLRIVCKLCMIKRDYKLAFEIIKSALCFTAYVLYFQSIDPQNIFVCLFCQKNCLNCPRIDHVQRPVVYISIYALYWLENSHGVNAITFRQNYAKKYVQDEETVD